MYSNNTGILLSVVMMFSNARFSYEGAIPNKDAAFYKSSTEANQCRLQGPTLRFIERSRLDLEYSCDIGSVSVNTLIYQAVPL